MNQQIFIEQAEQRARGFLQKWMKNADFRAAVQQPNPEGEKQSKAPPKEAALKRA